MEGHGGHGYGDYSYGYGYGAGTGTGEAYSGAAHNTAYGTAASGEQSSYASPYAPQYAQQHPQSYAQTQSNMPGADFFNNPAAQIGMQFGTQALSAGQAYVNSNLNRWISVALLREYFNVTNLYVFRKMALILFPFAQKNWERGLRRDPSTGQARGFLSPRDDVNAPDLYIPVMALVSYIILVGLYMGMRNAFHPELLGVMATSCIMGVIVEVVLIKLGCYLLSIGSEMHVLDFFAFSGYKFCILIVGLCGGAFGKMIKYCVFGYCLLCYGFFLIRSIRPVFVPENSSALVLSQRRRRINFLLSVVGLELLGSYLLLK